jgi:hypothetical protein
MRQAPYRLALFAVSLTIIRVAVYVVFGLQVGWLGYLFAAFVGGGVYVCAYFARHKDSRWAALFGLAFFMAVDMIFNVGEVVRTLSAQQLIAPASNFLDMDAVVLRHAMQWSALVFAVFPTIAAALLGWLQAGAEKVQSLRGRSWFGKVGIAIAAKVERAFPETEDMRQVSGKKTAEFPLSNSLPQLPGGVARWEGLSAESKAEISAMDAVRIAAVYGGSLRRARMWKQWIKEGKQ